MLTRRRDFLTKAGALGMGGLVFGKRALKGDESKIKAPPASMIFETVLTEGVAELSYLIGDKATGKAAVIDPRRDIDIYVVVHVNFADTDRHDHALGNIENILKEVPAATVEVVCHGSGISLVLRKDAKLAEKVAALMKQGVHFVACENTLKKKKLSKDELVAGVSTVPSGAVEVLRKQQDGYGYFKP